ncbi:MAG: hypothetical protein HY340_02475 [Candidatus Kerfeldbacteria bacterium]|nr:hypothetical protein [Candidatus Kerfeldbacteria bacterium]
MQRQIPIVSQRIIGFFVPLLLGGLAQPALFLFGGHPAWVIMLHVGGSLLLITVSILAFLRPKTKEYGMGSLLFCLIILLPVLFVYAQVFVTGSLM